MPSESPFTVQFPSGAFTAKEDGGATSMTVTRTGDGRGTVSVNYVTVDDSAKAGSDFKAASGTLTFADGETTKKLELAILDDAEYEGNELFSLKLSDPSGAGLGTPALAVGTITDNDASPEQAAENRDFVAEAYRDVLRREADSGGLDALAGQLNRGVNATDVMMGLQNSPENQAGDVQQWCQTLLGRAAGNEDLARYTPALAAGATREQVKAAVVGSDEYLQKRGGGSSEGFLEAVYRDALNRPIDGSGRATLNEALAAGVTRQQVAEMVFGSTEYRQLLVRGFYQQLLHREAEPTGLDFWVEALRLGATDQQVMVGFMTADEYRAPFSNPEGTPLD